MIIIHHNYYNYYSQSEKWTNVLYNYKTQKRIR